MAFAINNAVSNSISGNSGSNFTAGGACAANNLLIVSIQLSNVSSANQAFKPVVSDNVNTGNYTVWGTFYDATNTRLECWLYMIANASGTPTISLGASGSYNNGQWSYFRISGFQNSPQIDNNSNSASSGASPVNLAITPQGGSSGAGEIILALPFSSVLSGSAPAGFTDIPSFSGANIAEPSYDVVTTTTPVTYSRAQTTSGAWAAAILAFNDGAIGGGGGGGSTSTYRRSLSSIMPYAIKQSTTEAPLLFLMIQSSDHITGKTGASPAVTISKAGAAFAAPAGAVSEIGNGWYQVAGNATDTSSLGPLALHATAATCDPTDLVVAEVVAYDPQDGGTVGDVASAVWEESLAVHTTAGTGGQVLSAANTVAQKIPFSTAGNVKSDIKEVNDELIGGAGTATSPWGPSS